jgi:hypothetical protein
MTNATWFVSIIVIFVFVSSIVEAKEEHKKAAAEAGETKEEHAHGEGEEAEEGGKVGPGKGIIEANERLGFKLSPEALKNFDLKNILLKGDGPWKLPASAIVKAGEEVNLFRLRDGFFKRIDFQNLSKSGQTVIVDSDDMRDGDVIVVSGLGFLRIAELAAFGGVSEGHSH